MPPGKVASLLSGSGEGSKVSGNGHDHDGDNGGFACLVFFFLGALLCT